MLFRFDIRKTMQAVSVVMRAEETDRMGYLRMIKLLYHADRKCLKAFGRPITGDRYFAMKFGPVLSETYRLVKEESVLTPTWQRCYGKHGYSLLKIRDPGIGHLSRGEIEMLQSVARFHENRDDFGIADWMHRHFGEWKRAWQAAADAGRKRHPILPAEILSEVGTAKLIAAVEREDRAYSAFKAAVEAVGEELR